MYNKIGERGGQRDKSQVKGGNEIKNGITWVKDDPQPLSNRYSITTFAKYQVLKVASVKQVWHELK